MDTSNVRGGRLRRSTAFQRDRRSGVHFGTYGTNAGPEVISGNQFFSEVEWDLFGRGKTADEDPAINLIVTAKDESSVSFVGGPTTMRVSLAVDGEMVDSETFELQKDEERFAPGLGHSFAPSSYGSDVSLTARLTRVSDSTVADEVSRAISVPGEPPESTDNGDPDGGDPDGGDPDGNPDDEKQSILSWWGSLSQTEKLMVGGGGAAIVFSFTSGAGQSKTR